MSENEFDRSFMDDYKSLLPEDAQARFDAEGVTYEVGPIEPCPDALADKSLRTVVRRETFHDGKRFPFPIPNGWFVMDESRNLAPGEIRSLHAFGKDLVLFRSETGEARLVDAYCPHLGAHLGMGGKVDGDGIRCPFHGWRFDGETGRCTDVPYLEGGRPPAGGRVRGYPVVERNHMIWAWHHLEEAEPFYDVPEVPEFEDSDWLPYEVKTFEIATCVQEMAENDVDFAHFKYVHGSASVDQGDVHIDGPYRRTANGDFVRENHGLGLAVLHIGDAFRFIASSVPVDEEHVRQVWWFTAPRASGEGAAKIIADAFYSGVSQDLAIWENKRYRPTPMLTEAEKPVVEYRKWAKQFYSGDFE